MDHFGKILGIQKCMEEIRRNIIPVVEVTVTTFLIYSVVKYFLKE
jgi:thiamine biosynthesis protein ThiC